MVLEQGDAGDQAPALVRDPALPGVPGGDRRGRGAELEVHRPVGVGADHPAVAPAVEVVAHPRLPRLGEDRRRGRVGGGDQPFLAGLLVLDPDEDVTVVGGDAHAQEHALVGLLVDQGVRPAPGRPAEDLGGPGVLVAPDPEQEGGVGREDEGARGALRPVRQDLARGQVAHQDAVVFRALVVLRPGIEGVVGGVAGRVDRIIGLARRLRRLVQEHLFRRIVRAARPPDAPGMLGAGLVAAEVVEGAVRRRDGGVVGLQPALHLLEELSLQRLRRRQHHLQIGVLGLEVRADLCGDLGGIAQHGLPVVVLHPDVVVLPRPAELDDAVGRLAGGGGRGEAHGVSCFTRAHGGNRRPRETACFGGGTSQGAIFPSRSSG